MKRVIIACLLTLGLTQLLLAEPGSPVTKDGFAGMLLVTPDPDWEEKWNTSTEAVPRFTQASTVSYGEALTILTFFANPKPDSSGNIHLVCDIRVIRPDGSFSIDEKSIECAKGKLMGNPDNVRLSPAILKFTGEKDDLPGLWRIEINLTDKVRGTSLLLKSQFELMAQ
ncbi:MAG: hypothetical protein WC423_11330 [Vulcanimicrobiota bacterium]